MINDILASAFSASFVGLNGAKYEVERLTGMSPEACALKYEE